MPSMLNSQSSPASHRSWTFCTICPASPVMAKWPVCCGVDLKADSEGKELNFNKKQAVYSGWWKNTKANGKIKQEEKKKLEHELQWLCHWTPAPAYHTDLKVWLLAKNTPLRTESKKLAPSFIDPFEMDSMVNPVTAQLNLLRNMKIQCP